nr:MAG TPA: hypothetical protein [Caudoviricetes sp.]
MDKSFYIPSGGITRDIAIYLSSFTICIKF